MTTEPAPAALLDTDRVVPGPFPDAADAIVWAIDEFGTDLTLLCSGQDAVVVDLAIKVDPSIEIAFIDTGFHFDETIETVLAIVERYRPNLRIIVPWRHLPNVGVPDFCCSDHKVEQLDLALEGKRAWITGLRQADDPTRSEARQVEFDRRGLIKINPIVAWSDEEVLDYEMANDIIVNPLRSRGFLSIGCRPCTTAVGDELAAWPGGSRAGRWAGSTRTECGLHL